MARRLEQINALLQERVSAFLLNELELPGTLITVTSVTTAPDLSAATVWVSVLPANHSGTALATLRRVGPGLRQRFFRDLSLHSAPSIIFKVDDTEASAAEVDRLLGTPSA